MKTVFVVNQGHMDIEWTQTIDSYRECFELAVKTLIDIDENEKDYRHYYLDGAVLPLEIALDENDELTQKCKDLVAKGKLGIGPFYSQFDEFLISGESMIENCIWGNRRAKKYGKIQKCGYFPDNFGHPSQLPQLLCGFDIDSLIFMRGMVDIGSDTREFTFRAPNGSEVNAVNSTYCLVMNIYGNNNPKASTEYKSPVSDKNYFDSSYFTDISEHHDIKNIANQLLSSAKSFDKYYPSGIIPFFLGCDHCPPHKGLSKTINYLNSTQNDYNFVLGSAEEYCELIRANVKTAPKYTGMLFGTNIDYVFQGALSTCVFLKILNDRCERMIFDYLLPINAIAKRFNFEMNKKTVEKATRKLLTNATHDSIHGSGIDDVTLKNESRFNDIESICIRLCHNALKEICKDMKTDSFGAFAVYTPDKTENGIVSVGLEIGNKNVEIFDAYGKCVPCQVLPAETEPKNINGDSYHYALTAPTLHTVMLKVVQTDAIALYTYELSDKPIITETVDEIENEFIKVSFENNTLTLFDKINNRKYKGLLELVDEVDAGDAWDYSPAWIENKSFMSSEFESGEISSFVGETYKSLTLKYTMTVPAERIVEERSKEMVNNKVTVTVSLMNGINRLDVKIKLYNRAHDHRVRLKMQPMENGFAGSIFDTTPTKFQDCYYSDKMLRKHGTHEIPFRDFVADKNMCIATHGLYAVEDLDDGMYFTLLRSVGTMTRANLKIRKSGHFGGSFKLERAQCEREIEYDLSLIPLDNDEKSTVIRKANEYLRAPMAHLFRNTASGQGIKTIKSINFTSSINVINSCFRETYDGDGDILRVYEADGKDGTLTVFAKKIEICNLNEQPISVIKSENGEITMNVKPYEILTIKVSE